MQFETLSSVLTSESGHMVDELNRVAAHQQQQPQVNPIGDGAAGGVGGAGGAGVDLKPILLSMCANVFTHYMCSSRFAYDDIGFQKIVRLFDQIFWDINQGYAVDFLPWLLPVYRRHMQQLISWGTDIRQFILTHIIEEHRHSLDRHNPRDFTDALLSHLESNSTVKEGEQDKEGALDWNHVLYELEDFLGGHSAIGNLLMRAVGELCHNPQVMRAIQEEIHKVTGGHRPVVLEDRPQMPYTEAAILETLRLSSSPIVPHVAMQDTSVAGTCTRPSSIFS